jgi:hypothetical protein
LAADWNTMTSSEKVPRRCRYCRGRAHGPPP